MSNPEVTADSVCNAVFAALPPEVQDMVVQCVVIEPGADKDHPNGYIQFEFKEDAHPALVRKVPTTYEGIPIERLRGDHKVKG